MTTPREPPHNAEPVGPRLREAEAELIERLEEACADKPKRVTEESTGELVRLDNALHAAARAADDAVALRRRRRQEAGEALPQGLREFVDSRGRPWRVWSVVPGSTDMERYAGDYRSGWLAFELLDASSRKRLPRYPSDWADLDDRELEKLLESAVEVRQRGRRDD